MSPHRSLLVGLAIAALPVSASPPLGLPADLAAYRSWHSLLEEPQPIAFELSQLCVAAGRVDPGAGTKPKGPHTQRYIRVYARDPADPAEQRFPPGSVIAKEKLLAVGDREPDGVAFMVRHAQPEFPESGGWEFLYFPASGDRSKTQEACASCHKAAGDFVFGEYPK